MACGTPVVMNDNKSSRDYAVDGFNALISQLDDVKSLSKNLLKVILDDKLMERIMEIGLMTSKNYICRVKNFEKALKK